MRSFQILGGPSESFESASKLAHSYRSIIIITSFFRGAAFGQPRPLLRAFGFQAIGCWEDRRQPSAVGYRKAGNVPEIAATGDSVEVSSRFALS
jgi:hypothetical protein